MKKLIIQYPDFQKLDLRVGVIKEAKFIEGSRNLIGLKVDLGEDYGIVEILSGIGDIYKDKFLVGKKYIFVANLEPKKIFGKVSNGMILAADIKGKAKLFSLRGKIQPGSIIR